MSVERKNLFLENVTEQMDYSSPASFAHPNYPQRDRLQHANFISRKLEECKRETLTQKQAAAIHYKDGMYLEISGKEGYELVTKSLENRQQGIRLLNVQERKNETSEEVQTVATVYIPSGKESYFLNKVEEYASKETSTGKPKNSDLINSMEDVKNAVLTSFWLDKKEDIPKGKPQKCEIWLRYEGGNDLHEEWKNAETSIVEICNQNQIPIDDKRIVFPERLVKMVYANAEQLIQILNQCDYVAEIHKVSTPNDFFTSLPMQDQQEWGQELLDRTIFNQSNTTICLLDSGITQNNPLIRPFVDDANVLAFDSAWGTSDASGNFAGHGTEMAGVAVYNDLKNALATLEPIEIGHTIESVKILPSRGENSEDLYGAITQNSVNMIEIANPSANRVLCMAVTAQDEGCKDGRPSSWSAAIDAIAAGSDEEDVKRLFIVSAGNVHPSELVGIGFPDGSINHAVENPGQSWNALTVGAYCGSQQIYNPSFTGFSPVVETGNLSPYSSTSLDWSKKWPIKPEVLFDGGNMMTNGSDYDSCPDMSLLTASHRYSTKLFTEIWGTSSAAAQAAYFAARIYEEYPDAWPETIRALIVHSAEWSDKMMEQFVKEDLKTKGRRVLLRTCGYGIPNLNRALQCMHNSVNMVIQGELQPFSNDKMKDMHFHTLPWPKELLESLGNTLVRMKVTLSYFIDPAPGEIGWKDRYRYLSCGLHFEVNNGNQSKEDFIKFINVKMREDAKEDKGDGTSGTGRWFLGSNNRDVGSIHSDFIECSAVDLCECNYIAVYPIIGWWRERRYLGCSEKKVRYSLVVSLSTPENTVDLYTPIVTEINNTVQISI